MALIMPNQSVALQAFAVLQNQTPGYTALNDHLAYIAANGVPAYTLALNSIFASTPVATLATTMLANLGLTGIVSQADAEAYLNSNSSNRVGAMIYLSNVLYNYAGTDASVLAAQTAYKASIDGSYGYSIVSTNQTSQTLSGAIAGGGQTFTLTSGVDNIVGTSGNDTVIGDNTSAAAKQLSVADQINGGGGTDTLKVYLAAADTATGQPTLTSIENVWINGGVVTAYTAATGTTGLVVEAPVLTAGALAAATYTVAGQTVTLKDANVTANSATVIASATDTSENVTLNGWTATGAGITNTVDFSGTKVATVNLTSTGASNKIVLTNSGTALTTLNIAGDKAITITEALAGLKTINASSDTGGVTVDTSGVAKAAAFAFTGGSGNDKLTLKAGDLALLTSGAQLDGGTGTDTLVVNDTTMNTTALNKVVGFEVLSLGTTGATVDASSLTTIKAFSFGGVAAETISNLGAGSSVAITGAVATATLGAALGNSSTDITLGTTTSAGFIVGTLTTTGLITLSLTSNGTSANTITTFGNSDNTTVTVKGAADLSFTLSGTTTGSTVNAAAFTGKLTVTGSGLVDNIAGGTGADTITGAAGNDVLTGNAGGDKFIMADTTTTGMDSITDFVAGADKIITTGSAASTTTALALVDKGALSTTTYATLADAVASFAAGGANATTALQAYTFTYGTDTYAIVDNSVAGYAAGTDTLVKITGVTGTLAATDFINA